MIIKKLIKLSNIYGSTLFPHLHFNFARATKQNNVVLKDFTDIEVDKRQDIVITNGKN
jgi:hypothetical protein